MRSDNGEGRHWTASPTFWVIAALFVVAVYFFGLTIPLVGPDEPRYAQVAREMWQAGDWVTPTLGGSNWFEKPALLYWLQIASFNLFGVSEFAARFGSALFGLGTIASLWVLGRALSEPPASAGGTAHRTNKISFANLLGLTAASSIGIIVFSRGASFDIILTFPITASLVCYFIFDRAKSGTAALIGFYFFIGVALLAKGLVGIVFPFAVVTFYHLLSWKLPSRIAILSVFWGTLFSFIVASAWYVPMYLTHGWTFIDEFFIQHHFQRYTSNKYFHPQPFYFFLWVLPLMTIPWLPFFVIGLWKGAKEIVSRKDAEMQRGVGETKFASIKDQESPVSFSPHLPVSPTPLLLYSAAWLLVPLVFFSFSGSKLPGYILPSLPPCLIITAIYVHRLIGESRARAAIVVGTAAATFAVIVVLLMTVVPRYADDDSVKRLIAVANARGFERAEIVSQHTTSHNAEFYASGRLLRDESGKQKRLHGPHEILNEIRRRGGETVLVLLPNDAVKQSVESPLLDCEIIASNAEITILAARERQP